MKRLVTSLKNDGAVQAKIYLDAHPSIMTLLPVFLFYLLVLDMVQGFGWMRIPRALMHTGGVASMTAAFLPSIARASVFLSDTSISEEEVLDISGQASTLPDPAYAVGLAAIIFLGVGVLQFSLGDLTKEVHLNLHVNISFDIK